MSTRQTYNGTYFQLGGPNPDIRNDGTLTDKCFANKHDPSISSQDGLSLELVLGIEHSGEHRLLQPAIYAKSYCLGRPRGHRSSSEFGSLSPIVFMHAKDLKEAFKEQDKTSKMYHNKRFQKGPTNSSTARVSKQEHPKCLYENSRVLLRRLTGALQQPAKFSSRTWKLGESPFGFLFLTCNRPTLSKTETFLDIAWGFLSSEEIQRSPEELHKLNFTGVNHIDFGNSLLVGGLDNAKFEGGETTYIDESDEAKTHEFVRNKFTEAIRPFIANETPIVIVVFDWKAVSLALSAIGVDSSSWELSLMPLVRFNDFDEPSSQVKLEYHSAKKEEDQKSTLKKERRSNSPEPRYQRENLNNLRKDRPKSRIHVLDVRAMTEVVNPKYDPKLSLRDAASNFDLEVSTGWCAGLELRLLWLLWLKMADGPAYSRMYGSYFKKRQYVIEDEDDEDEDEEEDMFQSGPASTTRASLPVKNKRAVVEFSDDEDEYGDSD